MTDSFQMFGANLPTFNEVVCWLKSIVGVSKKKDDPPDSFRVQLFYWEELCVEGRERLIRDMKLCVSP